MRRRPIGLQQGQLETQPVPLIEINFNVIKDELLVGSSLFKALQALCLTNNFALQLEEAKAFLTESEQSDYNELFARYFINTREAFLSLSLGDNDLIEVQYAMQKKLFECLCEKINENAELELESIQWMRQAKKSLDHKHQSLPKVNTVPTDYTSAFFFGFLLLGAAGKTLTLLPKISRAISTINNDETSASIRMFLYFLLGAGALGIFVFLKSRALNDTVGDFKESLGGKFKRMIFAKPPASLELQETEQNNSGVVEKPPAALTK